MLSNRLCDTDSDGEVNKDITAGDRKQKNKENNKYTIHVVVDKDGHPFLGSNQCEELDDIVKDVVKDLTESNCTVMIILKKTGISNK